MKVSSLMFFSKAVFYGLWVLLAFPAPVFSATPDAYEVDDTYDQAKIITISNDTPQRHNFNSKTDVDWVKFYGVKGEVYTIRVTDVESNVDIVIELYDRDGKTLLASRDDYHQGKGERLDWTAPADGIYYVKLWNYLSESERTGYSLEVIRPAYSFDCTVEGIVKDAATMEPVRNALVKTDHLANPAITDEFGGYLIKDSEGTHTVIAEHANYETYNGKVEFTTFKRVVASFTLTPKGVAPGTDTSLPKSAIQANGKDGTVEIRSSDALLVTISMQSGSLAGKDADWWLYAETPFGEFYGTLTAGGLNWASMEKPIFQVPLFDLPAVGVLDLSGGGLPAGQYSLYFEVDDKMDGIRNGTRYSNNVILNITE